MSSLFTKENMARLDPHERRELMFIQMSPPGRNDGYVPDDCSYCDVCGDPILGGGGGLCRRCYARWDELTLKAAGKGSRDNEIVSLVLREQQALFSLREEEATE